MPFSYEFKLNKQKITGVEIGFSTVRKWEEALDEAKLSLPLMETDSPLSMLGLLQIEINEISSYSSMTSIATKSYDFLIYSDVISEATKYGRYKHELSMIEYTAKLDYYIMPSLAKSRSIISNVQAPFITDNFINGGTNDGYQITVRLPFIDIKATYMSGTNITFSQVEEAYIALSTTGPNYRKGGTYISTNAPLMSGSKPHNLSVSSATWKFPKGRWELYYGWVSQAGDSAYAGDPNQYGFHALHTFKISVIDPNQLSMFDIVDEIRSCVSRFGGIEDLTYYNYTRVFNLKAEDEAYLKTVQAPQMYLENATARQMLIFALSYINGLPRLNWGENIDILSIEKYNLSMGVFTMNDIVARSGQQNTNQIGSRSYSTINQALPNNMDNPTVYMPSQNGKVQVRSTIQQITADEFEIKLQENKSLYVPTDFFVSVKDVVVTNTETSQTFNFGNIDLSLMPRFINKDEWLLKNITNDFPSVSGVQLDIFSETIGLRPNRISNLSWQVGDTSIKLSSVYGVIFQSNLLRNVVIEALREYIMLRIPVSYTAGTLYRNYTLSYTIPALADYKDWRFRVEYITDENLVVKQEKEDISQINFYSEMRHNQDESLVNIVRQTRKSYGDLQRTGNAGYTFTKMHTSLSQEYQIGQRDLNGFTINEIHTQWHNNYFMNTYVVTKHHNRISQATFVDQTYRWRDNYAKTVLKRHEHYGDYLVIAPPGETGIAALPNKIYSNYTVNVAIGNLFSSGYIAQKTKAVTAFIRTDGMLDIYDEDETSRKVISVPVSSFGIKGGFVFTFGFHNNQVAGDGLVERGTNKWYNQAVRYTDEQGRFSRFSFWILRDRIYDTVDNLSYPLISVVEDDETAYLGMYDITTQYFGCGFMIDGVGSGEPMVVNKDPLTNYQQSYQLNVISHYQGLYVFGLKFFTDNLLVSNQRGLRLNYLYVYHNDEKYEMFEDLFVKSGYATMTELNSSTMSFDLSTLRLEFLSTALYATQHLSATSWAIGDSEGNLFLACNEILNGFQVFKTHIRPSIWEIGLKAFSALFFSLDFTSAIQLSFSFVRGKSLVFNFDSSMSVGLNMGYRKSKDIGIGISTTTISKSLSIGYVRGRSLIYNIDSSMSMALSMGYRISKDIGFSLNSTSIMNMTLSYTIGSMVVMDLGILAIPFGMTMGYRISKDIGINLNSSIVYSISMVYEITYATTHAIIASLSVGIAMGYRKSKDIGISTNSGLSIGLSIGIAVSKMTVFSLSNNLSSSLSMTFSRAYKSVETPSIINKTVSDLKGWVSSNATYWNAQSTGNRETYEGDTLPDANSYPEGFALKFIPSFDPSSTYYYRVAITGKIVRWKVVNNDTVTITIYAKVGSSSYASYGTLAGGATSTTLSKTVTDGQTLISVYATSTTKLTSNVVTA